MRNHIVEKALCGNFGLRRVYHWKKYKVGDHIRIPLEVDDNPRYVQACVATAVLNKRKHGMRKLFTTKGCGKHILLIRTY